MDRDLLNHITVRANECHGYPCVRGLRIRVIVWPAILEPADIRACVVYGASEINHPAITAVALSN
jgi:uncharacterized protein (DUF433 family)